MICRHSKYRFSLLRFYYSIYIIFLKITLLCVVGVNLFQTNNNLVFHIHICICTQIYNTHTHMQDHNYAEPLLQMNTVMETTSACRLHNNRDIYLLGLQKFMRFLPSNSSCVVCVFLSTSSDVFILVVVVVFSF